MDVQSDLHTEVPLASQLPADGFVRLPTILELIPVGRSTIFAMMKRGDFCRPVKLSSRISAWRVQDVRDYIRRQGPS